MGNHGINNSCKRRRGCEIGITLPYDSKPKSIRLEMHGTRNDIPEILPISGLPLDQMAKAKK